MVDGKQNPQSAALWGEVVNNEPAEPTRRSLLLGLGAGGIAAAIAMGHGDSDTAAVCAVLEEWAGIGKNSGKSSAKASKGAAKKIAKPAAKKAAKK